jgi:hypothetical protein
MQVRASLTSELHNNQAGMYSQKTWVRQDVRNQNGMAMFMGKIMTNLTKQQNFGGTPDSMVGRVKAQDIKTNSPRCEATTFWVSDPALVQMHGRQVCPSLTILPAAWRVDPVPSDFWSRLVINHPLKFRMAIKI